MELEKCHLLFGCEIMKFFSTGLLLLIVFGSFEGSTIPHKRTVRALNATIQTHFNGTIQRTNPCTNKEVERSSYRGCHEFHHHSKESNWSDYARKCATLISDFFNAISNLVSHKDRQSGTFDLNINTKVSHKTDGDCDQTKKSACSAPTVVIETKDCEVLPVASCHDLPRKATNVKDSETCATENANESNEQEEEKSSVGSEVSVNEEPQTAGSSSFQENDKCSDVSSPSEKVPDVAISEPQPTEEVNPPGVISQSEETIPTYDNYPSSDQTSETVNIPDESAPIVVQPDSGAPSEAPSTVITSAPINDLYTDADVSPQQSTGSGSKSKEASSDSKDYLSDYNSQTNEEKIEIEPSSSIRESFQTFSPSIQHYSSDTTTSPFEMKTDYDLQDIPENSQPTNPPQYESVNEPSSAVASTPLQPEPENYVNQYDQVPSELPTSSPPEDEKSVEFSDQLSVYNVRQPQPEAPSSSSLINEPTSTPPPSLSESQPENYVNYDDGLVSNQLPTSVSPLKGEEPSVEYSDQQTVYDVRQPYLEPTTLQPTSSETDNYGSVEDKAESTSSSVNAEPSVEVSDELTVDNIRAPTTAYPPSFVSPVESISPQPSVPSDTPTANYVNYEDETVDNQSVTSQPPEEPSIEFSDQLAVYNVREPLPGSTTPYPLSESSVQPSASQPDNYVSYEDEVVSQQPSTSSSPQPEDIQYLEYSDQLAVYNVREPFSSTTTLSPSDDSSLGTTLPPSFSSFEYDTYGNQITETEPQSTLAPKLEETSTFQTVTSEPLPVPDYYGEYNEQTVSNQMTTPAGNVFPTTIPSSEYIDSNGPQSPSPDYSASQDNGGLVSTSLPSSSDYTSSFNNFEQQYDSQPTSTQLPSDQVSDIREPQSDSSVSDERISDMVTAITPIAENSISYDYDTSLTDSQQVTTSESQPETSVTNEYPPPSSSNQPLPNNYETYDEQYSTSENEGLVSSGNEPTATYPIGTITTSPPSAESQNFGDYSAEPQGTYPPKINNESFANYEDNVTSPAGQAYTSIKPESDSSEEEGSGNEEGSSSQEEEDENFAGSDDQGLYPNTYRPSAQIETTVNYADRTPFRPTRLPSSFGPLQENNIVYDEGIFSNETEPSALGAEEPNKTLTVSIEHAKESEGKEFDSSTTLAPQLEFDTYYEETFKQPASSDPSKTNDNMTYEDDVLPSSPKIDINTTNDYSSSFFPSQEMITTPSTTKAMPETYTDYDYSQTDLNSKTTFPPQSESVLHDDHSSQDESLTQQQQSPDYSSYDYQIQSTSSQKPADQDVIEFANPETVTKSSSPSLIDLISSNMVTTTQPASPAVEPQIYDEQNLDTYANYEDTTLSQSPITSSSPKEVDPSLEFSDQTSIYNVRQPQPEAPSSSSLTNEPTSTPPPSLSVSQPENYVNYDDGLVSNQLPTSVSPPKGEEPSVEYSDQQTVYDVRQPYSEPTSSQPQPDNYDNDQDVTEANESTVSSSTSPNSSIEYSDDVTTYNVTPQSDENNPRVTFSTLPPSSESVFVQTTSPEVGPENAEDYEDEMVSNDSSTTLSSPQENPSLEVSDELAIYNVGQPSTVSPPSPVSYLYSTSAPPSSVPASQPDNYVSYEDEVVSQQPSTSPSPQHDDIQYLEYSDQLAVYNVREPFFSSTPSPVVSENIPSSVTTTPLPSAADSESDNDDDYEDETESVTTPTTPTTPAQVEYSDELAVYDVRQPLISSTPAPVVSGNIQGSVVTTLSPLSSNLQSDSYNYEDYKEETVPKEPPSQQPSTSPSPQNDDIQYLEYSDQLAVYNVREPLSSTTTWSPTVSEDIPGSAVTTPIPSYDYEPEQTVSQSTFEPQYEQMNNDTKTTQSAVDSQPESYKDYEEVLTNIPPSQDIKTSFTNNIVTTVAPSVLSENYDYGSQVEYTDSQTVVPAVSENTLPPVFPSTPATSSSPTEIEPENYLNYESGDIPTTLSPSKSVNPFLEYSDQLAVYNVRQPESYSSSPSPLNDNLVTTTAPNLPSNDYSTYDTYTQSKISPESESQVYDDPATSVSQSDAYTNYEGKIISNEVPSSPSLELTTQPSSSSMAPSSTEAPFQEYSDELSIYNARQPYSETTPSSPAVSSGSVSVSTLAPFPSRDSFQSYDSPVTSSDYTSAPPSQLNPESQVTYEDYGVQKEALSSTLPPSELNTAKPDYDYQPTSPAQSQDNYVTYDEPTVSNAITTFSPVKEVEPSVEYSDQLAVYNVREPIFSSTPSPIVSENIPSSLVTTLSPSTAESESDNDDDYEDETETSQTSTTPTTPAQVEYSDELSIYNIHQRPSEMSTLSPSNENIPTFAPSFSSDKSDSYDYQPVVFESQPTSPPESGSQTYYEPTSAPSTSSQSQDYYVNYENDVESNKSKTTLRPAVDGQPSLEYSDDLTGNDAHSPLYPPSSPSPLLNDYTAADTVSTLMPSPLYDEPTLPPPTSPNQQHDSYVNYEDQFPITSSPPNEKPSMTSLDQLSVNNSSAQPYSPEAYDYGSHVEYTDSQTVVPTESTPKVSFVPTTTGPLTSSQPQPEQYVNYEDESTSTLLPTSTSSTSQIEPSVEFSDQLAVYNVREPIISSTPSPVVNENIPSSLVTTLSPFTAESESDNDDDYEDETESDATSTTPSTPAQVEYSDELEVYDVRKPLISSTPPPVVSGNVPISVVSTLSPPSSNLQSDSYNYEDYKEETVPKEPPSQQPSTSPSPQPEDIQYLEYSDQLAVYNVREPLSSTTTWSPTVEDIPGSAVTTPIPSYDYEPEQTVSQSTFEPQYEQMNNETKTTQSAVDSQADSYKDYEEVLTNIPPSQDSVTSFTNSLVTTVAPSVPSENYDYNSQVEYTDSQTVVPTESAPKMSFVPTTTGPLTSFHPQPEQYVNYEDESSSTPLPTSTSSTSQIEPSVEYSDEHTVYNVREPLISSTPPSVVIGKIPGSVVTTLSPSTAESESDNDDDYEDETESDATSTTPTTPAQVEYSDELAVYDVREPLISSTPVPVVSGNIPGSVVSTLPPSSSNLQSDSYNYEDYEEEKVLKELPTTLSTPTQVEPSVEFSDQLAVYNVRQPQYSSTSPSPLYEDYSNDVVTTVVQPTSPPQSDSQIYAEPTSSPATSSVSQLDDYVNYEDTTVPNTLSSTLSPTVQEEPSVEFSDQLAVYNVREPFFSSTPSPVVSENIPSSVTTTLLPSAADSESDSDDDYEDETEPNATPTTPTTPAQVEYSDELAVYDVREPLISSTPVPVVSGNIPGSVVSTISPSAADSESDNDDDYEDEVVSTLSPMMGDEPSVQLSDELSIYNVRQRPSQLSTPSPFTNNVISNFMTTISPFFTSSSIDNESYERNDDDRQANSDETTETLNSSDDQTNVIQSLPSPDPSNQLYSTNEVESITTVKPSMISDSSFEPSAKQEFDYQLALSPDYDTNEKTVTTPPSSSPPQDNYVVYDDQTVSNAITTSSPVNHIEPSSDYSNQPSGNNSPQAETYSDYEGSTAPAFDSPPTAYDEPRQVQTSTSRPDYDYYTDQTPKSKESSTSPPTTEIDTHITLTEFGPTLPPDFESQIFKDSESIGQSSSEIQPDNYTDYEDSTVSSSQTNPQPSIEVSDDVAVANVRKPYFKPTTLQPSSSEPKTDDYDTYDDQVTVNENSTPSTPQKVELTVTQSSATTEGETQIYDEPTSSPATSSVSQLDDYVNYEDTTVPNQLSSTLSPTVQGEPSVEFSDQLAVYNVREPISSSTPSPVISSNIPISVVTSLSPSTVESESDNDDYDDETESVPTSTTPTTPAQVEYSDELAVYDVREPLISSTPVPLVSGNVPGSVVSTLSPPSSNLQSDSYNYEDYEEETVSKEPPTTLSTPTQVEPSVEFSDQLAVYNVREPIFSSTPPPVVIGKIPGSVVTTLPPSSTESESNNDDDYEDETESDATSTTPSTPAQVEYSDELAVYDVHKPLFSSTPPPVVIGKIPGSVVTTLPPSSSLVVEQISSEPFSSEPQSDSDDDYEDETVSTLPPMIGDEPSVQLSNELSIYNVRQRPSQLSTPSPFSNSVISNLMTTISPFFTSSSNDNESSPVQSSETSELEIYDEPTSTSNPSSESVSNNDVDSGEEQTSDEYLTSTTPPTEDQTFWSSTTPLQYPGQLSVYNVRQRPSEFSSPSPQMENFSDNAATTAPSFSSNDYDSYSIPNDEPKFSPEAEPKSYDPSISTQNPSVSQPENYVNYDDETVSNDFPTSTTGEQPSIEFSDQLSIYNVGKPSTPSPLPSLSYVYPSSTQPSIVRESQPSVYDESVPAQTSSPEAESDNYDNDQDETEVNESTVSSTLPPSSESVFVQTTSSGVEPETAEDYEDEMVSSTTLSSPQENPSLEVSDELAIYNVGKPSTVSPSSPVSYLYSTSAPPSSVPASQPDNYVSYEDEVVSQQPSTSPSPQHEDIQYLEYSDQLAVYNVREPLSSTTTWSPTVSEDISGSAVTTPIPSYDYEPEQTVSQSTFEPQYKQMNNETNTAPTAVDSQADTYEDYEEFLTTTPPSQNIKTSFTNNIVPTVPPSLKSENYDYGSQVEYTDSQTVVPTESSPQMSFVPTTTGPLTSSQPQPEQYVNYEDESSSTPLPTSTSSTTQIEPSVEYSDEHTVYNVREPLISSTPVPVVSGKIPGSVVTTLSPSTAESESDNDDDYEDETQTSESSTTPFAPAQVELSDELAVYDVREPLISSTPVPIVSGNIPISVVSTLPPPSSNLQSDNYNYEDYEEETVSKTPPTTLSTPTQVEPSVEFSDQLAVYNVRQPAYSSTSPSPLYEDYSNDAVTTVTPSLSSGGFKTYNNPATYIDFQPTSRPQTGSQILNAPTSSPASFSDSETDEYGNYDPSNEAVTSVSPPVDADLEYSTELDIYNIRQPFTSTLVPSSQNSVQPEQDDVYTYDDPTQSKTTSSPETETEYDDDPTTQPLPETMVTTFQPLRESQITKPGNKTRTPSNQQQPSTFAPLHSFFPLNQPSYPLPVENKQQDQVTTNQFVSSSFPELDSDKQSNNLSDIVRSQDGFENAQRDTPQPEPLAQVPDQSNPSNEPGEENVTCTCRRGDGKPTNHTLLCPFNPVLKGNMTAPSYYILITKLFGGSGNQSQSDEEHFQVEKVYLGDGTPLNCTDERKIFPTSKYIPIPIASSRTVKLPIRLNNS